MVLQYRPLIKGKESVREAKPLLRRLSPFPYFEVVREGSLRGASPLYRNYLPLPLVKGKGIKGIGLLKKN